MLLEYGAMCRMRWEGASRRREVETVHTKRGGRVVSLVLSRKNEEGKGREPERQTSSSSGVSPHFQLQKALPAKTRHRHESAMALT